MNLDQIEKGQQALLDANIILSASFQKSAQCVSLVERCASGEIKGLIPLHVMTEINHRLMCSEARHHAGGILANPAKTLAGNPSRVRELEGYRKVIGDLMETAWEIVPLVPSDLISCLDIQAQHGLMTNDALIVAVARRIKCSNIATADKAFQNVPGLILFHPTDLTSR
jgi:predicted nucleic acid-binding protein